MRQIHLLATAILFALAWRTAAQTPGGVGKPSIWTRDTLSVKMASGSGLTYIGVSKVSDDREQALWSLGNGNSATHVQTTGRAINLHDGTFMNYAPDSLPEMRLYSYTTSSGTHGAQTLHIGRTPDSKMPVKGLGKGVMEHVVYDRRLSDAERCRVESHLALKYGISLRSSYLNSRGAVIWNAFANKTYSHRIAGVISDSLSGLHLTRARSCENGHLLTVSTGRRLADGQSFLWGDDNGKPAFVTSKAHGKWLGRQWKGMAVGMSGRPVDVIVDSRQFRQIQPLAEGESCYLAVDPTGTGDFSVKASRYYKASSSAGDSIIFRNIPFEEKNVFTLLAARNMFTTIHVSQPEETGGDMGSLDIRVTGGIAPYRMRLNRDHVTVYDEQSDDSIRTVEHLADGTYSLVTTDPFGHVAENEFMISARGITEIPSDAASGHEDDDFFHVRIHPNPAAGGSVSVEVELSEEAPLDITLHTAGGAKVSSAAFTADTYFRTDVHLPSTGVHLLSLHSGTHEKTVKLMRK